MNKTYDIAVIGDWHLAFVTAACLADAGHKVTLVNPFGEWREFPSCPVHEPGLAEMIAKARGEGFLQFENGVNGNWGAKAAWLAIDTPVNENDEPDVRPLLEIANALRPVKPSIFITSSQIPITFSRELEKIFGKTVAYVPENLRLGSGIATFAKADRTVIGSSTPEVGEAVKVLMQKFTTQFLLCDLPTAEMVKHANNAFLAASISFANELARIGARFNVDSYTVAKALKLDARIGPKAYVAPGLGFAGGTLPRDLRVLEKLGRENNIPTPLVSAVLEINRSTSDLVAEVVLQSLKGGERNVLILGYTYKADTDTLRRSLSLEIAAKLKAGGVTCHGFDPFMNGKDLGQLDGMISHHDRLQDVPPCGVALLMTPRPLFRDVDWTALKQPKTQPTLLVDTQGFLSGEAIRRTGMRYRPLWAPEA